MNILFLNDRIIVSELNNSTHFSREEAYSLDFFVRTVYGSYWILFADLLFNHYIFTHKHLKTTESDFLNQNDSYINKLEMICCPTSVFALDVASLTYLKGIESEPIMPRFDLSFVSNFFKIMKKHDFNEDTTEKLYFTLEKLFINLIEIPLEDYSIRSKRAVFLAGTVQSPKGAALVYV